MSLFFVQRHIKSLSNKLQELNKTIQKIDIVSKKIQADTIAKLNSVCFVDVKLKHTSQVMVNLGAGYFLETTKEHALQIASRRKKCNQLETQTWSRIYTNYKPQNKISKRKLNSITITLRNPKKYQFKRTRTVKMYSKSFNIRTNKLILTLPTLKHSTFNNNNPNSNSRWRYPFRNKYKSKQSSHNNFLNRLQSGFRNLNKKECKCVILEYHDILLDQLQLVIVIVKVMRSDLQVQILRFYRESLKWIYSRPQPLRSKMYNYLTTEMRKNQHIHRIKFNHIQHLLRMGRNRLQMLKEANIDDINLV